MNMRNNWPADYFNNQRRRMIPRLSSKEIVFSNRPINLSRNEALNGYLLFKYSFATLEIYQIMFLSS